MYRIAALNDNLSDSELENDEENNAGPSREVLESTAHANHTSAISYLVSGNMMKAEENFLAVLNNPYVANADVNKCQKQALSPETSLKYSCFKNLGSINMDKKCFDKAREYYLKALEIDSTEVGVCYRLGLTAIQLRDFELALQAFQEGLHTSPNHLICLDQLLSVLLILGMHIDVLVVCTTILSRHPSHAKARTFARFVLNKFPHYGDIAKHLARNGDILFDTTRQYDVAAGEKYLETCMALKREIPLRPLPKPEEPVTQQLACPLTRLSWSCLASALLYTLNHLDAQDINLALMPLDMLKSLNEFDERVLKLSKEKEERAQKRLLKQASEKTSEDEESEADTPRRRTTIETGSNQSTFRVENHSSDSNISASDLCVSQVDNQNCPSVATGLLDRADVVRNEDSKQKEATVEERLDVVESVDCREVNGTQNLEVFETDKNVGVKEEATKRRKSMEEYLCDGKRIEVDLNDLENNGTVVDGLVERHLQDICVFDGYEGSTKRKHEVVDNDFSKRIKVDNDILKDIHDAVNTNSNLMSRRNTDCSDITDKSSFDDTSSGADDENEFEVTEDDTTLEDDLEDDSDIHGELADEPETQAEDTELDNTVSDGQFDDRDLDKLGILADDRNMEVGSDICEGIEHFNTCQDESEHSRINETVNNILGHIDCRVSGLNKEHEDSALSAQGDNITAEAIRTTEDIELDTCEKKGVESCEQSEMKIILINAEQESKEKNLSDLKGKKDDKTLDHLDANCFGSSANNEDLFNDDVILSANKSECSVDSVDKKTVVGSSQEFTAVEIEFTEGCYPINKSSIENLVSAPKENYRITGESADDEGIIVDNTEVSKNAVSSFHEKPPSNARENYETKPCPTEYDSGRDEDDDEDDQTDTCDDKTESATDAATDFDEDAPLNRTQGTPRGRGRGRRRKHLRGVGRPSVASPLTTSFSGRSRGRRGRRGLERELQQLDYWGRAEDGIAVPTTSGGSLKRRRRVGHDCISSAHLIRSFVPAALLETAGDLDEKMDAQKSYTHTSDANPISSISCAESLSSKKTCLVSKEPQSSCDEKNELKIVNQANSESDCVRDFIFRHGGKFSLITLINRFLQTLVEIHLNVTSWSTANATALLSIYLRYRETIQLCSPLNCNPSLYLEQRRHCLASLAFWEVSVSTSLANKTSLDTGYLEEDFMQLTLLLSRVDITDGLKNYKQRISWLHSQRHMLQEQHDKAVSHLHQVVEECEDLDLSEIPVWRTETDTRRVTLVRARRLLQSLMRRQLVENIENEFAAQNYHLVVEVVSSELSEDSGYEFSDRSQRVAHCTMLLKALEATNDGKGMLEWGVAVVEHELQFLKQQAEQEQDAALDDEELLLASLEHMHSFIQTDSSLVHKVSHQIQVRLVSALTEMLTLQLEQQCLSYSVTPWLLLHRILLQQELQSEPQRPRPSTLLLVTAHEELARVDRCCREDGRLLLYVLPLILEELQHNLSATDSTALVQARDQVTFCLYHLPSKRLKKGVRDHGSGGIPLTYEQAMKMFPYFCPTPLPLFHAPNPPSISDDCATLFKKFIELIPNQELLENRRLEIDELLSDRKPDLSFANSPVADNGMADIFYLLADYYFKSKEWETAVEYYILDIAMCSSRLDSWAGLSLCRKTQIETRLNSCELIKDEDKLLDQVEVASICFKQALKIDEYHSNLWVEFGGLVYMAFSYASRMLKQDLNPNVSIEMYQRLEQTKIDKLAKAAECFTKALDLSLADEEVFDDERWLYYYMLGKIAEKQGKLPEEIIAKYLIASEELHTNCARYPSKINYSNPSELSVEALEMYFRVHSYIIKYLEQKEVSNLSEDVLAYFLRVTDEISKCPFVKMLENNRKNVEDVENGSRTYVKNLVLELIDAAMEKSHHARKASDNTVQETQGCDKLKALNKIKHFGGDDDVIIVEETQEQKDKTTIINRCLAAFRLCLTRFQHHYKSLYRLAYYYQSAKFNKDNNKTKNLLMGCSAWHRFDYMPVNGLFNERKISYQYPRNCNLFHGVWRIPNDEIDRSGSFAGHMYRCVSLALDVLPTVRDFVTTFDIALALKHSPDKDKKYLRESDRLLLQEHATQVGLRALKDKFRILFKTNAIINRNRRLAFLLDVYKCYKHLSKHLLGTESTFSAILTETYSIIESVPQNDPMLLRKAEMFCTAQNAAAQALRGVIPSGRGRKMKQPGIYRQNFLQQQQLLHHQQLLHQQQLLQQNPQLLQKAGINLITTTNVTTSSSQQVKTGLTNISQTNNSRSFVSLPNRQQVMLSMTKSAVHNVDRQLPVPSVTVSSVKNVVGQTVSGTRSQVVGGERSLATPQPRSTAAPVPRSTATPVPRSTASIVPRVTASSASRSHSSASNARSSNTSNVIPRSAASSTPTRRDSTPSPSKTPTVVGKLQKSPISLSDPNAESIMTAYKAYENLIICQTNLKNNSGNAQQIAMYKSQVDSYQKELLQYLKIPAVSAYFQKSLQQMGNTAAKLPPPYPLQTSATNRPPHVKGTQGSSYASKNVGSSNVSKTNKVSQQKQNESSKNVSASSANSSITGNFPNLPKGITVSTVLKPSPEKKNAPQQMKMPSRQPAVNRGLASVQRSALLSPVSSLSVSGNTTSSSMVHLNTQQLLQLAYSPAVTSNSASVRKKQLPAKRAPLLNSATHAPVCKVDSSNISGSRPSVSVGAVNKDSTRGKLNVQAYARSDSSLRARVLPAKPFSKTCSAERSTVSNARVSNSDDDVITLD